MLKMIVVIIGLGLAMLIPSEARADKLSDFKDADRYELGCTMIPVTYRDQREACEKQRNGQNDWCDGSRRALSCKGIGPLRVAIVQRQRDISEFKDKKSRAESNKSSATADEDKRKYEDEIKQLENAIYNSDKELYSAKSSLDYHGRDVADAIYNLENCLTYRRAAVYAFEESLDKMRNEKSTPEIEAVAYSLVKKYYASIASHKEMIRNLENSLRDCKEARP